MAAGLIVFILLLVAFASLAFFLVRECILFLKKR